MKTNAYSINLDDFLWRLNIIFKKLFRKRKNKENNSKIYKKTDKQIQSQNQTLYLLSHIYIWENKFKVMNIR